MLQVTAMSCNCHINLLPFIYSDSLPWGVKPSYQPTIRKGAHQQSFKFLQIRKNRRWRGGF